MQINLSFDASVANASARWVDAIKVAAGVLDTIIKDPITVTFAIGFGEIGGQAMPADALGVASPTFDTVSYGSLVSKLAGHAEQYGASPVYQSFLSHLPQTDPMNGQAFHIPEAEAKAIGLLPANFNSGSPDAYIGFGTSQFWYDPNRVGIPSGNYDLIGTALHELTHGLGRVEGSNLTTPMNLFTYSSSTGQLDMSSTGQRYVSYDGGKTAFARLDSISDPSDLAQGSPSVDPFDTAGTPGVDNQWTAVDSAIMEMLGYDVAIPQASSQVSSQVGSIGLSAQDFALGGVTDSLSATDIGYSDDTYFSRHYAFGSVDPDQASYLIPG